MTQTINNGNTAWVMISTALVLMMTLPGLALYYGGMMRSRNVLSVLMQSFTIAGVVTIIWMFFGYSLIATHGGSVIGSLEKIFLVGVERNDTVGTIPESVYIMFQLSFAIISSVIIIGAFVERTKLLVAVLFCSIWVIFSYLPIC